MSARRSTDRTPAVQSPGGSCWLPYRRPRPPFYGSFKIHLLILNHSGPGDSQMSSLFQANLEGNDFYKNPLGVAFDSRVTLKNMGWGDSCTPTSRHTRLEPYEPEGPLRYLKDGDTIRLSHLSTGRNLRSHTVTAPVSKLSYEMSGYGNLTVEDNRDYWQIAIVDDTKRGSHLALGYYLRAANAALPQWAFKQIEKDAHTYWNVENHWNDRLPAGDMKLYKPPFLRDFWHLNVAMMTSNNALVPDPDKEALKAVRLAFPPSRPEDIKYYLMGTPVVWWGSTISLGVALLTFTVYILRWQRKYNDMDAREWDHFLYVGKIAFFEWAFHYVPFLIMGRVTYLHHYLPTLYFAVLMFGHVLDHFVFSSRRFSTRTKATAFGVLVSDLAATFWWFSGVALGIDGPVNEYWGLKWRKLIQMFVPRGLCLRRTALVSVIEQEGPRKIGLDALEDSLPSSLISPVGRKGEKRKLSYYGTSLRDAGACLNG
ncbi:hypothetical protein DFP72DRAFT_861988 [Ephemerocybe angulata]|uniref:Dolichyl-phosphate-mannose--protein mannosyltransferase n=1 Tax=Ephemerocybe angulata TaxID=980116 RepID=A0A8H6H8L5_9AGAR|nr:hypothetical protein DFP72DRAFT_861988 [Tulosesus angulatus]